MSKLLIAMLLLGSTGIASVASAAPQERGARQARSERSAESDQSEHSEQPRAERAQPRRQSGERQQDRAPQAATVRRGPPASPRSIERDLEPMERIRSRLRTPAPIAVDVERSEPVTAITEPERRATRQERIERRNLRRAPGIAEAARAGEDLVEPVRRLPRVLYRNRPETVARAPRFGAQAPEPATALRREARPERNWSTGWRRDRRFDWHDHRRRHRSLFRLSVYLDPFGWDYFRYGIGWRLWPGHYRRSFWLHDPWMYRLPPAYGPYRWVRYWDDALLVNIYTGSVVDVVHNFFW